MTLASFQSSWGKAYKYLPLKWSFLSSVLIFELGSLACGRLQISKIDGLDILILCVAVAKSSTTLIAGRAITGLGGAGVVGGVYVIVTFIVPPPRQPAYIGLTGAVFSIASVAGPLLGGVLTGKLSWRWWLVWYPSFDECVTNLCRLVSISIFQLVDSRWDSC